MRPVPITRSFAELLVDTINELAEDAEEAGYTHRAASGRKTAERLRKKIVKPAPAAMKAAEQPTKKKGTKTNE